MVSQKEGELIGALVGDGLLVQLRSGAEGGHSQWYYHGSELWDDVTAAETGQ